jgi:hypothetical protein
MKEDTELELLEAANWKQIIRDLALYSRWQARRYPWRSGTHNLLPGGKTPEDMAFEAIAKVWQGKRNWDSEKYPDLLSHLKWIVKSDLGHLFASIQHQKTTRLSEINAGPEKQCSSGERPIDSQTGTYDAHGNLDPESEIMLREQQIFEDTAKDALYALVKGDTDLELLLLCFEEGLDKPETIAAQMDWEVSKVYNLKKRLLRKAAKIRVILEVNSQESHDKENV